VGDRTATWFILGVTALVGIFFFRLIQPLLLPLILAAMLAAIFWPVYQRVLGLLGGHERLSAAVTTVLIMLTVMLPTAAGLSAIGFQLVRQAEELIPVEGVTDEARELVEQVEKTPLGRRGERLLEGISDQRARQVASEAVLESAQQVYQRTTWFLSNVVRFLIATLVVVVGLYYFLADSARILGELRRLSPLEEADDWALMEMFVGVCRGVLLGNVLAAAIQAILAGIAFAVLGVPAAWLLGFATFFISFVPFLGAAGVWGLAAIVLLIQARYLAAAALVLYGTFVISSVDNVIRALAIHDRARLHPLAALVSLLGGLQVVGLWGIIVGPVTAAFFYVMLNILKKQVTRPPLRDLVTDPRTQVLAGQLIDSRGRPG
jgi:predicted PurR-regulated permease PerM